MTDPCCPEFATMSRRGFLTGGAALLGATTTIGSAVVRASAGTAFAASASARAVLVVVSLRGAADGLSLVVPHGDPVYATARPSTAVDPQRLLAKDGFFGLHPELAPLLPLWSSGRMAAVHATGLPVPNRSHFAAMEEVEDADPGSDSRVGWLNRLIGIDADPSPLQGFSLGAGVPPTSLSGPQPTMSAEDVESMSIAGDDQWDTDGRRLASLHRMWDRDSSPMGRAMSATFRAMDDFEPVRQVAAEPQNGAQYPDTDLGRALREVARIIRGDVGVEVVTVDQGDWDHHRDLSRGVDRNAADLAGSVAAFFQDLGDLAGPERRNVTLVTLSEFGRRVRENANAGTDHGWGNVMFLAGAGVAGGRYYGSWLPLSDDQDADLQVTTDYRSVLAEVAAQRFGASVARVFPGLTPEHVGVMRST